MIELYVQFKDKQEECSSNFFIAQQTNQAGPANIRRGLGIGRITPAP
jgi:hypothetical protein